MDHAFDLRIVGEADEDAEVGGAGDDAVNHLSDRIGRKQLFYVRRKHLAFGNDDFIGARD